MADAEFRHNRAGRIARELFLHSALVRRRRGQPTVLFLPSQGQEDGAANLRTYMMAASLRTMGWNAEVVPKHLNLQQRSRVISTHRPDVLVMQTARHSLNRPGFYPGVPTIFDIDDADYIAPHSRPAVIEAVSGAAGVIAGSRSVAAFCRTLNDNVEVIWTGTPLGPVPQAHTQRAPIVTWAVSNPASYPAEAEFVTQVLRHLRSTDATFSFRLYGRDGSKAYADIAETIRQHDIPCEEVDYLSYDEFIRSMNDVSVGLAPLVNVDGFSGGKSFGKILAYFSAGVPIITHPVVDHPLVFDHGKNGFMCQSPQDWANCASLLLADATLRDAMSDRGRVTLASRLSVQKSAELTDVFLRQFISR